MFQDTVVTKTATVSSLSSRSLSRECTITDWWASTACPLKFHDLHLLSLCLGHFHLVFSYKGYAYSSQYNYFSLCETAQTFSDTQLAELWTHSFRFQNILYVPYNDDSSYSPSLPAHLLADWAPGKAGVFLFIFHPQGPVQEVQWRLIKEMNGSFTKIRYITLGCIKKATVSSHYGH